MESTTYSVSDKNNSLSVFESAFARLRDKIDPDDEHKFSETTLKDVRDAALATQKSLQSKNCNRALGRLQPFFAGLEIYAEAVDVLCNGTPYLPWIWAPVKLILGLASKNLKFFEKLMNAYALIAEAIPRFDRLQAAFKSEPAFQRVLGMFYKDILEFHRETYKFAKKSSTNIFFKSLWTSFELRFDPILDSLRKHRDLVDQDANAINIAEAKASREQQLDVITRWRLEFDQHIQKQETETRERHVQTVSAWLGTTSTQEDLYSRLKREYNGSEPSWLLAKHDVILWLADNSLKPKLWIHGKPGIGKSVTTAFLSNHAASECGHVVLRYFSTSHEGHEGQINDFWRNLISQLVEYKPKRAGCIFENISPGQKPTNLNLQRILADLIQTLKSVRIIVDGLDEFRPQDQEELPKLLEELTNGSEKNCKILLSSRRENHLGQLLKRWHSVPIDNDAAKVDHVIRPYVKEHIVSLEERFSKKFVKKAEKEIIEKANGMILWVKLVLASLKSSYSESDAYEILNGIPVGLTAIYDRIVARICDHGTEANRRKATRILQWLLVAQRSLKQQEIESGILFDDKTEKIDDHVKIRGEVLNLCSPLIEIEKGFNGCVSFIHFTAKEHLSDHRDRVIFHQSTAHFAVSLSCITYLSSGLTLISPNTSSSVRHQEILDGKHALQFYANDFFLTHYYAKDSSGLSNEQNLILGNRLLRLVKQHNRIGQELEYNTTDHFLVREETYDEAYIQDFLERLKQFRENNQSSPRKNETPEAKDPTLFNMLREQYQSELEALMSADAASWDGDARILRNFQINQGRETYFCRKSPCRRASRGFSTLQLRDDHENNHSPRYTCEEVTCDYYGHPLPNMQAFRKHQEKYHKSTQSEPRPPKRPIDTTLPERIKLITNQYRCPLCPEVFSREHDKRLHLHKHKTGEITSSDFVTGNTTEMGPVDFTNAFVMHPLADIPADRKNNGRTPLGEWAAVFNPWFPRRFDIENQQTYLPETHIPYMQSKVNTAVAFSRDGTFVALGGPNYCQVFKVLSSGLVIEGKKSNLLPHQSPTALCFCGQGNGCDLLAIGCDDGVLYLPRNGIVMRRTEHTKSIHSLCCSEDGTRLVSGSRDSSVRLWRLPEGDCLFRIPTETERFPVTLSPGGHLLAVADQDQDEIKIWRVDTLEGPIGSKRHLVKTKAPSALAFLAADHTLVSGASDGKIKLWHLPVGLYHKSGHINPRGRSSNKSDTSIEVETSEGHTDTVLSISASECGKWFLSTGHDGVVGLWSSSRFNARFKLQPNRSYLSKGWKIVATKFCDGHCFATVEDSGVIQMWRWLELGEEKESSPVLGLIGDQESAEGILFEKGFRSFSQHR